MKTVVIDGSRIDSEIAFHSEFAKSFGFPAFYGGNFNAWIDCMGYLDEPNAEMTSVHIDQGTQMTISVSNADKFKSQCPDVWFNFLECAAFINWRRVEKNMPPLLVISAYV